MGFLSVFYLCANKHGAESLGKIFATRPPAPHEEAYPKTKISYFEKCPKASMEQGEFHIPEYLNDCILKAK